MNLEIMQTAKLLRNGLVAAGLLLVGGCELLSLDDGRQAAASADAASAKLPPPPPPAPRVARAAARRLAPERDSASESTPGQPELQTAETMPRGSEPPQDPQDQAPQPTSAAGAEPPAAEPAPQSAPQQIAALPTPADLPPPVDPASEIRPQRVVGLTENALAGWLGSPANTREESPARVWRYQGIECAFDVFFYLDLVSREFRALRYEVKGSSNDDQRCLQPVFAGRGAPPRSTARRVD